EFEGGTWELWFPPQGSGYAARFRSRAASYTVSSVNSRYAIVSSLRAKATIAVFLLRWYATLLNHFRSGAVALPLSHATKCAICTHPPRIPPRRCGVSAPHCARPPLLRTAGAKPE